MSCDFLTGVISLEIFLTNSPRKHIFEVSGQKAWRQALLAANFPASFGGCTGGSSHVDPFSKWEIKHAPYC